MFSYLLKKIDEYQNTDISNLLYRQQRSCEDKREERSCVVKCVINILWGYFFYYCCNTPGVKLAFFFSR